MLWATGYKLVFFVFMSHLSASSGLHKHIRRTYLPEAIYFVTTNVQERVPYFLDRDLAEMLIGNLWWSQKVQTFIVYAFVVMPDHLHLLVQPQKTRISDVLHSIKNNSSRDIRRFLEKTFKHIAEVPALPLWREKIFNGKRDSMITLFVMNAISTITLNTFVIIL